MSTNPKKKNPSAAELLAAPPQSLSLDEAARLYRTLVRINARQSKKELVSENAELQVILALRGETVRLMQEEHRLLREEIERAKSIRKQLYGEVTAMLQARSKGGKAKPEVERQAYEIAKIAYRDFAIQQPLRLRNVNFKAFRGDVVHRLFDNGNRMKLSDKTLRKWCDVFAKQHVSEGIQLPTFEAMRKPRKK